MGSRHAALFNLITHKKNQMLDLTWIADVAGRAGTVDEAQKERRRHRVRSRIASPPR